MNISIIIPCYNEEEGIKNLFAHLETVEKSLSKENSVDFVFVDDGSTDNTYNLLKKNMSRLNNSKIVRHKQNKNLGAALKTGFKHAKGNLIATIDSDCTYPPIILVDMLKMMDKNTDIVTASPYHPKGKVDGVPGYRLLLSKSISLIYRIILWKNIRTFTAMFRIYRRKVIENVKIKSNDFLGVTELMIFSLLKGYKVKEYPTTLHVRKYGTSKIRLAGVIKSHMKMIVKLLLRKITRIK